MPKFGLLVCYFFKIEFLFRKLHSGDFVKFSVLQDRYINIREGCSEIVCRLWAGCWGGNHEITRAVVNTCSCILPAKCRANVPLSILWIYCPEVAWLSSGEQDSGKGCETFCSSKTLEKCWL